MLLLAHISIDTLQTFFGEDVNSDYEHLILEDSQKVDLVIIMGTSLSVIIINLKLYVIIVHFLFLKGRTNVRIHLYVSYFKLKVNI